MNATQPKLFELDPGDASIDRLVELLKTYGWLTRARISELVNWDDRTVRACVEAAPERLVSGQKGFNVTSQATADELSAAARQSIDQAKKMERKGIIWQKLAHAKVG